MNILAKAALGFKTEKVKKCCDTSLQLLNNSYLLNYFRYNSKNVTCYSYSSLKQVACHCNPHYVLYLIDGKVDASVRNNANDVGGITAHETPQAFTHVDLSYRVKYASKFTGLPQCQPRL